MLKCMNMSNINKAPCSNLIHVECSEYSTIMLKHLQCYYCADCINADEELAIALKHAEDEARAKVDEETQESPKVSMKRFSKLERVAEELGDKLNESSTKLEQSETEKAEAAAKIKQLEASLKAIQEENERLKNHGDSLNATTSSQLFADTREKRASTAFDNTDKMDRLCQSLRHAELVNQRFEARRGVKFESRQSYETPNAASAWPNYFEQERRAKALDFQALLLVRSCIVMQPFTGDVTKWSSFISDFIRTSAKGHFREHEDMERLRDLIKGEAYEMFFTELSDPTATPVTTIERLNEFYGVRGSAVKIAFDKITQLHRVEKNSDKDRLKTLYTALKQYVLQCQIYKQEEDLVNVAILHMLDTKLCNELRCEWRDWAKRQARAESIFTVIAFLEERIRDLNMRQCSKPAAQVKAAVFCTEVTGGRSSDESSEDAESAAGDESSGSLAADYEK
jgi:hypothetical protein